MTPLLLLLCTQALSTDRPTTAFSAEVAGPGRQIIESGIDYANGARAFSLPTSLRLGATEFLELRLDTTFLSINTDGDVAGGDFGLGFKSHLTDNEGLIPSSAILFDVTIPIRRAIYRFVPRFLFLATWALPWDFSGSINTGLSWVFDERNESDEGVRVHYVVGVGRQIVGALGGFVGTSGYFSCNGDRDHAVRTGLVYLINDDLQVDIFSRFDLQQAENVTVGSGMGVRF